VLSSRSAETAFASVSARSTSIRSTRIYSYTEYNTGISFDSDRIVAGQHVDDFRLSRKRRIAERSGRGDLEPKLEPEGSGRGSGSGIATATTKSNARKRRTINISSPAESKLNYVACIPFRVMKLRMNNKYNPTRGLTDLSPSELNLAQVLTQYEVGNMNSRRVSCEIISALFNRDFKPDSKWTIMEATAHNVTSDGIMTKRYTEITGIDGADNHELEKVANMDYNVYRSEKRAAWSWEDIQSESSARGDIWFMPGKNEIRVDSYEYHVAGYAKKPAPLFERLFKSDTAASASLKRVKIQKKPLPRLRVSNSMKSIEQHRADKMGKVLNNNDKETSPNSISKAESKSTTVSVPLRYTSTRIKLLMSSKYTRGRGFSYLDPEKLNLIQVLATHERTASRQSSTSCIRVAHAIIESLFNRDFMPGPKWDIEPSSVTEIDMVKGQSRMGQSDLRVFRVEKRAVWDYKDVYSVASAKGIIRFIPNVNEIRIESYAYYVAG